MYIIAQHKISDPAKFWDVAQAGMSNLPKSLKLHKVLPNADGSRAVCLWEAGRLDQVRTFVDGSVGRFSTNEFFEVEAKKAVGLP
jgi:hypothetical protein